MPYLPTKHPTWFWQSTATPRTSANPKQEAGLVDIFFMSKDVSFPPNNGAVLNIAQIMKTIMSLEAVVETGAMYVNAHKSVPAHQSLHEMGHHHPGPQCKLTIQLLILS